MLDIIVLFFVPFAGNSVFFSFLFSLFFLWFSFYILTSGCRVLGRMGDAGMVDN